MFWSIFNCHNETCRPPVSHSLWYRCQYWEVEFLDYSETGRNLETHVTLHQWWTYTMKDEIICLQQCWEKCLEHLHVIIPAYKIRIKNSGAKLNFILLNTLKYFRNMNWNIRNKWNTEWKRYQSGVNQHIWRKSQHNTLTKPKSKTKSSITKIMQRVSINTTKKYNKIFTWRNVQQSADNIHST